MKTFLATFLLALTFGFSYGQQNFKPGYIVTLQGDTLRGLVNNKSEAKNTLTCNFKASENATVTDYAATELAGYGFTDGKIYESKKVVITKPQVNLAGQFEEQPVKDQPEQNFMKVLVKGKSSLYSLLDADGQQHYYLQKEAEPVHQIFHLKAVIKDPKTGESKMHSSKQYIGALTIAFNDCSKLNPQIQKTPFKESALIELVSAYNSCINPGQAGYVMAPLSQKPTWGAIAGISYSMMQLKTEVPSLNSSDYTSSPTITGGFFVDFPLSRLNEKLSLHLAPMYVRRNYHAKYDVAGAYSYTYDNYDVTFNLEYIRLMSLLRFTLPTGKFRPFISAGISNGKLIKDDQTLVQINYFMENEPRHYPAKTDFLGIRKYERGFVAGAGLLHALQNGKKLTLETRFERSNGFTSGVGFGTATSNVSVLLGVGL